LSDVHLHYDKTNGDIQLSVNGENLNNVAAVNVAVSSLGSVCTVVFETDTVNIDALLNKVIMGEEAPTEHGGN
jgi:hypothetical protein